MDRSLQGSSGNGARENLMFLFFKREVKRTIKIRDEWGQMRDVEVDMMQDPRLSDQDLADALRVSLITVKSHRRD